MHNFFIRVGFLGTLFLWILFCSSCYLMIGVGVDMLVGAVQIIRTCPLILWLITCACRSIISMSKVMESYRIFICGC